MELAAQQAAAKAAEQDEQKEAEISPSDVSDSASVDSASASDSGAGPGARSSAVPVDAEVADGDGEGEVIDEYGYDGEDGDVAGEVGGGVVRVERRRSWTFRVRGAGEGARRRRSGDDARSKETPRDGGLPGSREDDEGENP